MSKNIEIIRGFVAAWNNKNLDALISLLADDVIYHNMPVDPIVGSALVRKRLTPFLKVVEKIRFDVAHMAESSSGAVLVEKEEHYWLKGEEIILDSMNTFEVKDGKITFWRAYFDPTKWTAEFPVEEAV